LFLIILSTIVRQEVFGISNRIIQDENERLYFPSSQILFSNVLQFELTYKKAYFTFPIVENLFYSFYFDSSYGIGIAYKFNYFDFGINGFKINEKFYFNFGSYFKIYDNEFKFAFDYIRDSFGIRGAFRIIAFEQMSFRFYGEYKNNFYGIIGISYEPTAYRFLIFGTSILDSNYYAFCNSEFFIFRDYITLRLGVYQNLKNDDLFINYGFSLSYQSLRADFIVNENEFKLAFYYKFKIF